jgi:hypothetical protein
MNTRNVVGIAWIGLAMALLLTPGTAHSESVGAAAAVRPSSTGTPPGGSAKTLEVGSDIVAKERIRTTNGGTLQVMFHDKTTLTIGPSSDLVIDDFVYKPGAGNGRFVASLGKGAVRFVGGQVSHTSGATITTPVATLGIRGGAAFVAHDAVCQANKGLPAARRKLCTKIVCTAGLCTVKSRIDTRSVQLRISQAVEIGSLGMVQFNVSSVTLNDVAKGGSGGIVAGKTSSGSANFTGHSTIDQTISEQSPEPPPPTPP